MKRPLTAATLLLIVARQSLGDLVFDVTFDQPLYTNGQSITGGLAPGEPSFATAAVISDAVSGFNSQAAIVYADYAGAGINFNAGPFSTGVHRIQWDMSNVGTAFGGQTDIALSDDSDDNLLLLTLTYVYWSDGSPNGAPAIMYWGIPGPYPPPHYFITPDARNTVALILDLDNNALSLTINDNLLIDQYTLTDSTRLNGVEFYQSSSQLNVQYAIDDFRWEIVPEPSSLLLMIPGVAILLSSRKRKAQQWACVVRQPRGGSRSPQP